MGCTIVFVILLVIGMGILCFLTGDMTAFIALAATLSHRTWSCRYSVSRLSVTAAAEKGQPAVTYPALDECRRFHPDCSQPAHEFLPDGRFPVQ